MTHLLLQSDMAKEVWHCLGTAFNVSLHSGGLFQFVRNWCDGANMGSSYGFGRVLVCCIGLWKIWLSRNAIRHDEQKLNVAVILHQIKAMFSKQFTLFTPKTCDTRSEAALISSFHGCKSPKVQLRRWIVWSLPERGSVKCNFDAAYKDKQMGGGGVFRNELGKVLFAFSFYSSAQTVVEAELKALCFGLDIARREGIGCSNFEGDNLTLINILKCKQSCPWALFQLLEQYASLLVDVSFSHCFREVNRLADELAKNGLNSKRSVQSKFLKRGSKAQALCKLDEERISTYRICKIWV